MGSREPRSARIGVLLAAGGSGTRFGRAEGKQLAPLLGRPALVWSLEPLASLPGVVEVVIACHPDRLDEFERHAAAAVPAGIVLKVVAGGASRQLSVFRALEAVSSDCDLVLVHDGARPLVTRVLAIEVVERLLAHPDLDGVIVGHPSVDTLKRVSSDGDVRRVLDTPDRSEFWLVQTPQVFRAQSLRTAHDEAVEAGFEASDDSALVERSGGSVSVVEGPRDNLKLTQEADLAIAEAILRARAEGDGS